MSINIDKDVPIPRSVSEIIRTLEVGESFAVPGDKNHSIRELASVLGKKLGRKYRTRTIADDVRVWRLY